MNDCIKEFVWANGETGVAWENKDLRENLFHDVLHKITNSATGLGVKVLNNSDLKNIQRTELVQEGANTGFFYNC